MEVMVKKDLFGMKLSKLKNFAGDAKTVPVHGNFLLKVLEGNSMEITIGDGNTFVTDTYNMVTVTEPGAVTVSAKDLSKLISDLGAKEEVILKLVENRLVVKSGRSEFKLNTIPAEQYPNVPTSYPEEVGKIPVKELQAGLQCAKVCVAKDMTNPYLTGFRIDSDLFTSDSLKICIYESDFGGVHLLVSSTCVDAVLMAANVEFFKVSKQGNSVLFDGDGLRIVSNMVGGIEKFPQAEMFTKQEFDYMCKLDRQVLLPILNRATIFTVEDLSNAVKLSFGKGELKISSYNTKDGAGSYEVIECEYAGEGFDILVDGKDFIDELSGLGTEQFELWFDGPKSPEDEKGLIKIKQGKLSYMLSVLDVKDESEGEKK